MLPIETISAVFPSSARLGRTEIGPTTIYHAAALEALGVELSRRIPREQALLAAWVMSLDGRGCAKAVNGNGARAMARWLKDNAVTEDKAFPVVNALVEEGFASFVAGKTEKNEINLGIERGFGWPLEIAECIAAEHSIDLEQALETPLCRAGAIIACARQRNGGESVMDYFEKRVIERMRAMRG